MNITTTQENEVLRELENLPWCVWRRELRPGTTDKYQKTPYEPYAGKKAKPNNRNTWRTFYWARLSKEDYDGMGFLLTEHDPFTVVDLDNVINLDTGEIADWASKIVEAFDSYTEFSPSGTGLHIIIRGETTKNHNQHGVEVYSKNHYMTWTGNPYPGFDKPIRNAQNELDDLLGRITPDNPSKPVERDSVASVKLEISDSELLAKIRRARGDGERFKRLYDRGDISHNGNDPSRADLALCGLLAKWTAEDPNRMDRFFRNSKLMRPKWNEKRGDSTYGRNTIQLAIKNNTQVYDPNYKGKASNSVQDFIEDRERWMMQQPWSGRSGATDRDIYKAFLVLAKEVGTIHQSGDVEVPVSVRQLGERAGITSRETITNALTRLLVDSCPIEKIASGKGTSSSTYRIKKCDTNPGQYLHNPQHRVITGTGSCQTIRIRHNYATFKRLGKRNGQIIDVVYASGDAGMDLDQLTEFIGIRKNSLKSRNLTTLVERGFLVLEDGRYFTPGDIEDRLEQHLEISGCNAAADKQKQRHEREREQDAQKRRNKDNNLIVKSKDNILTNGVVGYTPHRVNPVEEVATNMTDAWDENMGHELDCECLTCSTPKPRYAKLRQNVSEPRNEVTSLSTNKNMTNKEQEIAA